MQGMKTVMMMILKQLTPNKMQQMTMPPSSARELEFRS
jgi:hypothetical protein